MKKGTVGWLWALNTVAQEVPDPFAEDAPRTRIANIYGAFSLQKPLFYAL